MLEGFDNLHLVLGGDPGKDTVLGHPLGQLGLVQAVQLLAGEHLGGALRHAQALGDGKGCGGVVAGNHHRQNARALALGHRLLDAGAGRVLHGDEAAEHQAAFCLAVVGGEGFHVFIGHGQHPQGPAG